MFIKGSWVDLGFYMISFNMLVFFFSYVVSTLSFLNAHIKMLLLYYYFLNIIFLYFLFYKLSMHLFPQQAILTETSDNSGIFRSGSATVDPKTKGVVYLIKYATD